MTFYGCNKCNLSYEFEGKQNLQILFAQFLLNVFLFQEMKKCRVEEARNVITSLKEFITTLICLYLHSYFIMLRDCRRNETIYIHKKCFQCLLHQSSAAFAFL